MAIIRSETFTLDTTKFSHIEILPVISNENIDEEKIGGLFKIKISDLKECEKEILVAPKRHCQRLLDDVSESWNTTYSIPIPDNIDFTLEEIKDAFYNLISNEHFLLYKMDGKNVILQHYGNDEQTIFYNIDLQNNKRDFLEHMKSLMLIGNSNEILEIEVDDEGNPVEPEQQQEELYPGALLEFTYLTNYMNSELSLEEFHEKLEHEKELSEETPEDNTRRYDTGHLPNH